MIPAGGACREWEGGCVAGAMCHNGACACVSPYFQYATVSPFSPPLSAELNPGLVPDMRPQSQHLPCAQEKLKGELRDFTPGAWT